jgi:hypothetical protein
METTLDLTADTIDVRDIIARVEEIRKDRDGYDADALDAWRENYPGDEEELKGLESILDDLKGAGGDVLRLDDDGDQARGDRVDRQERPRSLVPFDVRDR